MKTTKPPPPHLAGAPAPEPEHLPCPRCSSTNTKFCYYNNYNFSQPRHFCKSCRRYWTHGGTLRDVPVGGATRKRHRSAAVPPPPPPEEEAPAARFSLPLYGSFTSLLGSPGSGSGFLNPFGSGFVGPVWGFGDTWQMGSGGGECFSGFPELSVSTPGFCLK